MEKDMIRFCAHIDALPCEYLNQYGMGDDPNINDDGEYECNRCGMAFSRRPDAVRHMQYTEDCATPSEKKRWLTCPCKPSKRYGTKNSLAKHLQRCRMMSEYWERRYEDLSDDEADGEVNGEDQEDDPRGEECIFEPADPPAEVAPTVAPTVAPSTTDPVTQGSPSGVEIKNEVLREATLSVGSKLLEDIKKTQESIDRTMHRIFVLMIMVCVYYSASKTLENFDSGTASMMWSYLEEFLRLFKLYFISHMATLTSFLSTSYFKLNSTEFFRNVTMRMPTPILYKSVGSLRDEPTASTYANFMYF